MRISEKSLTPEQQKALNVMTSRLFSSEVAVERLVVPVRTMFPTDYVGFTDTFHFLKKGNLPTDNTWSWNQSNAKQTISLDENRTVTIQKMNPRRKRHVLDSPSYKIWIFVICEKGKSDIEFIWCEKGLPASLPAPICEQKMDEFYDMEEIFELDDLCDDNFVDDLKIEDLSFLSEFADVETCIELGWF
mmetsp:Transcript_44898/g.68657  ORF Transcript_44898/g.68657 Transcript_44898/m.68657 type:complete len:189 (+) Transcript_44898:127-693(+)